MSYQIKITRRTCPEPGPKDIQRSEWDGLIESDPELETLAGSDGSVVWCGKGCGAGDVFHWNDGEISAGSPTRSHLDKMIAMANVLGAIVVGGDSEVYTSAEEVPVYCDRATALTVLCGRRKLGRGADVKVGRHRLAVGDQVIRKNGIIGTVAFVDGAANEGLGRIGVDLEVGFRIWIAAVGHDLRRL